MDKVAGYSTIITLVRIWRGKCKGGSLGSGLRNWEGWGGGVMHSTSGNEPFHANYRWHLNELAERVITIGEGARSKTEHFVQRRISLCEGADKDPEEFSTGGLSILVAPAVNIQSSSEVQTQRRCLSEPRR